MAPVGPRCYNYAPASVYCRFLSGRVQMARFFPFSPPRRDDTWRTRRDGAAPRGSALESVVMVHAPPPIVRQSTRRESSVVYAQPGMSPETVVLTAYRADGRPFIRVELPADLAPAW